MVTRNNNSFIKKQKANKRIKKRQDKQKKKAERKENSPGGGLENMIAYVDEFGNITSEKPADSNKQSNPNNNKQTK